MRIAILILAALVSSTAQAGQFLTTTDGKTLYIYSKDYNGKSECPDVYCAHVWQPYLVDGPAREGWTIVERDSGAKQWAYKGKPVYTFSFDKYPGDTTGDAWNGGEWWGAKP